MTRNRTFPLAIILLLPRLKCFAASTDTTQKWREGYTPEQLAIFDREQREVPKRETWDREHYVRLPPAAFKPEANPHKIVLSLVPERAMIRRGQRFRYRVEIQNVGSKPVDFFELKSFIKTGHLKDFEGGSGFDVFFTAPDQRARRLQSRGRSTAPDFGSSEFHMPGAEKMTLAEQEAAIAEMNYQAQHQFELSVHLQPGESIVSKGYYDADFGTFREMQGDYSLGKPGTYRFQLDFTDLPPMSPRERRGELEKIENDMIREGRQNEPYFKRVHERRTRKISREENERYREAVKSCWGHLKSNTVAIEVVP